MKAVEGEIFSHHLFNVFIFYEEVLRFPDEHLTICFKSQMLVFKNSPYFAEHRHLRAF